MSKSTLVPKGHLTAAADPAIPSLRAGDLYFNTGSNTLRAYTGTVWIAVGAAGVPATTVVTSNVYAQASAVGTSTNYAREDHVHGTPSTPVTTFAVANNASVNAATGTVTLTNSLTPTFTSAAASGMTGAVAASRYAGGTASGAPATGTFALGDFVIAQNGHLFICTVAGTPGTWVDAGVASNMVTTDTTQTISGAKTFSSTLNTGTITVTTGNITGATTVSSAYFSSIGNALRGTDAGTSWIGATAGSNPVSVNAAGNWVIDVIGSVRICTVGGNPGTWVNIVPIALNNGGTISANFTVSVAAFDNVYTLDATNGAFTVTIPITRNGRVTFKKIDTTNNVVTLVPASGLIDGAASFALNSPYASASTFGYDGFNLIVL